MESRMMASISPCSLHSTQLAQTLDPRRLVEKPLQTTWHRHARRIEELLPFIQEIGKRDSGEKVQAFPRARHWRGRLSRRALSLSRKLLRETTGGAFMCRSSACSNASDNLPLLRKRLLSKSSLGNSSGGGGWYRSLRITKVEMNDIRSYLERLSCYFV
jgi:hypothetical protein